MLAVAAIVLTVANGSNYHYGRRYVEPIGRPERYTSHPHTIVLDFWGWPGVARVAALVTMSGTVVVGMERRLDSICSDPFRLGALGGLLAGGVHGLIDNSYVLPDLAILIWVLALLLWLHAGEGEGAA